MKKKVSESSTLCEKACFRNDIDAIVKNQKHMNAYAWEGDSKWSPKFTRACV